MPCGKPQAVHFAHMMELLQWLPTRVNFTNLKHYDGWSVRTHARWFARLLFARLAVAALRVLHPRPRWELLVLDTSFMPKSGRKTWGVGWFWSGIAAPPAGAWKSPCWPPPCLDRDFAFALPKQDSATPRAAGYGIPKNLVSSCVLSTFVSSAASYVLLSKGLGVVDVSASRSESHHRYPCT